MKCSDCEHSQRIQRGCESELFCGFTGGTVCNEDANLSWPCALTLSTYSRESCTAATTVLNLAFQRGQGRLLLSHYGEREQDGLLALLLTQAILQDLPFAGLLRQHLAKATG